MIHACNLFCDCRVLTGISWPTSNMSARRFFAGILFFDIVEIIGRDAQAALVCFAVSV